MLCPRSRIRLTSSSQTGLLLFWRVRLSPASFSDSCTENKQNHCSRSTGNRLVSTNDIALDPYLRHSTIIL